ncbi:MAG: flagellar brake domain-containing protein [Clostridia bacterium]|nr:flagellar brake domain-containing protein [Clostridia bacterium]
MNIREIVIGTRLEVELINSLGEKTGQTYVSQLIDIVNNEDALILCPIYESKFVFIAQGSNMRSLFMHDKYGLMSFTAVVTNKEKKGNILLLHIKLTSEIEKIQRRKYYRFDCNLNALYRIHNETDPAQENSPVPESAEFKKAITRNLSGNGTCIVVSENIPKGSFVEVQVFLSDNNPIKAVCIIMRNSEIHTSKEKKYELGLYFKKISAKDQDSVVKYIFDQQRLQLKRESK